MEQKRVSFSVAKALKEVGYPQGITRDVYFIKEDGKTCIEYPIGVCISSSVALPQGYIADIPYAMDVWLWLWREKHIAIELLHTFKQGWGSNLLRYHYHKDPEEAIIAAIEYLIENKLLK